MQLSSRNFQSLIFSLCITREQNSNTNLKCPSLPFINDFNIDSVLYSKKIWGFLLCLIKSRGIPILILKCASLGALEIRAVCTACTACIAACADRQMRDTPAWPLSSGTALQIMQRCIGSRGPYGGGAFISAVVIGARESTPCALLPLSLPS